MVTDGIEPATNGLLDQRSTDWAMPPTKFLIYNTKNQDRNELINANMSKTSHGISKRREDLFV